MRHWSAQSTDRMEGAQGFATCAKDIDETMRAYVEVEDDDMAEGTMTVAEALEEVASELGDRARARARERLKNETRGGRSGPHGFDVPNTLTAACGSASSVIQPSDMAPVYEPAAAGDAAPEGGHLGQATVPEESQPSDARILARASLASLMADARTTTAERLRVGFSADTGAGDDIVAAIRGAGAGVPASDAGATQGAEEDSETVEQRHAMLLRHFISERRLGRGLHSSTSQLNLSRLCH